MDSTVVYVKEDKVKTGGLTTARKIALLAALYLTQGVPFGFFTQAFPSLMRKQGYSLEAISVAALLALPWAIKFLWAPAVDRFSFRRFGRRKSWLVPMQILTTITLLGVAFLPMERLSTGVLFVVFAVNLMIATQDIAADGLAVDILAERERGVANGVQVAGYRLGMIVGGGLLLIVYDRFGWTVTFASMAALVAVASIPMLTYAEPSPVARSAVAKAGIRSFMRRPGVPYTIALITVYKFGEAFASGMVRPFLVDSGFDLMDIGLMLGIVGFSAILVGGLIGGVLVNTIGRKNALVAFGIAQVISIGGFAYLSLYPSDMKLAYIVCTVEHFASGMANAALFTCMMDWSVRETGATDYTVQASQVVIASGLATTISGFSASRIGYFFHFTLAAALAAAAVLVVVVIYPKTPRRD